MAHVQLSEGTVPSTPAAGKRIIFASSDGVYGLDSAGGTTLFGAGGGGGGGIAAAAGTQTATSGTVVFSNSNNFTFGMSGSTRITASFSESTHSHSTGPGAVAAGTQTGTSGTIVFANSNDFTFGMSGSSQITASFSQSTHSHATAAYSGSNGSFTANTLSFGNLNGLSFYTSNGSIVGSYTDGGGGGGGIAASAGTQLATSGTIVFANSNNFTFGMSGSSQITASFSESTHSHDTFVGGLAAGTQTATSGTIVFSNSNNFTFGMSGSTRITASFSESTHSHASPAFSGSNGSFTANTVTFGTLNGLTFYTSNGSMVGSHNALTSQSNQAFSAAGGSSAFQTLGFSDTNGVSFSNSNGSVVATVRTNYASSVHDHNATLFATSNTTQSSSGTVNISSIVFAGAGIASVGVTNGSVVISVPSGGGAGDGGNILAAGTRTAGSNSTVLFSNANGVTFGLDAVNGSVMTASVAAGGGAAIPQYYATSPWAADNVALITNITALSQRPIFVPFQVMGDLTANELMWKMSRSTNSSNNFTVHLGVYSYVNSTQISLLGSNSHSYSNTATASITGVRMFEVSLGTNFSTFSAGQYIAAFIFSNTASASANYSLMGGTTLNPHVGGIHPGADTYVTHTSHQPVPMHGRYTTTSGALPASVGASQIIGQLTGASMAIPMGFTIGWDN